MSNKSTVFSFLWNLKDFSMLMADTPDRGDPSMDIVKSPAFRLDPENRIEFCLVLYQHFEEELGLDIECNKIPDDADLELNSLVYVIPQLGEEELLLTGSDRMVDPNVTIGMMDRQYVFDNYLQNDTLSLRINLELRQVPLLDDAEHMMDVVERDLTAVLHTCKASSRLVTHRKRVVWSIDMSQLSAEGASLPVASPYKHVPAFRIAFSEDAKMKIAVESGGRMQARCTASVLKSERRRYCVREHRMVFDDGGVGEARLPEFVDLARLREEKYFDNTNNMLYLQFDFAFSTAHEVQHTVACYGIEISHPRPRVSAIPEFASLYESGIDSNAELRCEGMSFPINSLIVGARSKVFEAMFRTDMAEAKARSANITDLDPETLDRLLKYCYSNTIQPLDFDQAASLYSAADKYGVLSLRCHCSLVLMSLVAADNVCKALTFANLHEDEDLFDCAVEFVRNNQEQVLPSEKWNEMLKDSETVAIAAKVMHRLLLEV